jgi:hypothetical protein
VRLLAWLVLAAGLGGVVAGGLVFGGTMRRYAGCVDECHGAALFGAGGVLLFALGLALLAVAATLFSQGSAEKRGEVERELKALRARMRSD